MSTNASRDTTTGLKFEEEVKVKEIKNCVDISKTKLKKFLKEKGINNPTQYLSWMFQPDEAYFFPEENKVVIYEKKFQQTYGSADEKLGACAWKIGEYRELFNAIGINDVSYIFIFCDWFKQKRYKKLLKYIKSVDGCGFIFEEKLKEKS